jgi:polyhydroxybutyrate depolymerase
MTSWTWAWLLGMVGVVVGSTGCWRANLYAITGESVTDGSGGETSADSVTCPSPVRPAGDSNETLQVGSVSRSYVLHIPPTYDGRKPAPLIVDFHGIGTSGASELSSSPYPAVTNPDGVIMAFPDGKDGPIGSAWNVGPCCVAEVDDVAFAKAMVVQIKKTACIDADRIYAVGVLTGGGMANYLACRAAEVFAAVAPAAFDLLQQNVNDCIPARPITVISFRGTADARVPYAGGASTLVPGMPITFLGAKATFERWAQINRCTGSPSPEDSNGCSMYSVCQGGVEVVLCTKQGGREEPGDATVAWPLLKRHTL